MKRMQIYHTFAMAAALVLMALPFGVKGYYAMASDPTALDIMNPELMSFFDGRLFSFNHPLPFIAGISVLLLTVLSVLRSVLDVPALSFASVVLSGVTLLLSLMPLMLYGIDYYSTVSMAVSFLLLCAVVLDVCILRNIRVDD